MSLLTEQQLRQMFPNAGSRLDPHLPYIVPAMEEGYIDSPRRIAAFLAQLAHESGEYRYMEEIADGSAYEGREDLGNVNPGDGVKYKGHGPMQITGRYNHARCGAALGLPLLEYPTLLTRPEYGTRSAVWYWNDRGLSPLADLDDFREITRRINGGFNGWDDRVRYWERNRLILGLPASEAGIPVSGILSCEEAIKRLQVAHGLEADGVVGPITRAALGI